MAGNPDNVDLVLETPEVEKFLFDKKNSLGYPESSWFRSKFRYANQLIAFVFSMVSDD